MIRAVVFDLDGLLLDSEQIWDEVRREVVAEQGGRWRPEATADMQGMSAPEWSRYVRDRLGVDLAPDEIDRAVVDRLLARYRRGLPLLPGAAGAVRRLAARWPLALATSSDRVVIERVLDLAGLAGEFAVTVSSEEVGRGKPAPDVYLAAAHRLGPPPEACAAVEDSTNGVRAAVSARLAVVLVPNPHFPPAEGVRRTAHLVLRSLDELSVEAVAELGRARHETVERRLDEAELESFPASDAHADWQGPPG